MSVLKVIDDKCRLKKKTINAGHASCLMWTEARGGSTAKCVVKTRHSLGVRGQGKTHQERPVVVISSCLTGSYAQPNSSKSQPRLMTQASSYVALESAAARTVTGVD